jgi:outer membrane immunogenic protein
MLKFTATAACVLIMAAASQAAETLAFPTDTMVIRAGIDETPAPTAASPDRWTGAYAGIAAGYGMLWDSQNARARGMDFGGFAGYNIRVAGPVVGGLEAEFTHINREFDDHIGVFAKDVFSGKLRLGYAHDRFFAYGLVGAQHATSKVPLFLTPGGQAKDTTYVLGAGVDVAVTNRLALGAEYTRAVYHSFDYPPTVIPIEVHIQRVNARLTYKIN